jgi:protein-tyrosine phosphatase
MPVIVPAAEVYLERGIRDLDLRPLCYAGTDLILVELPYTNYQSWFLEEVYHFCLSQSLTPVFAHLDRYLTMYNQEAIREILDFDDAVIQINHEALFEGQSRKALLGWIKEGHPVLFGSDCHNLTNRSPRNSQAQSVIKSKIGKNWLAGYERYSQKMIENPVE